MVPSVTLERDRSRQIALLNDAFRVTFLGGTVCITAGLHLIGDEFVKAALLAVREFTNFTDDNDPYAEHDLGTVVVAGRQVIWKIEYFDPTMTTGSEDPASIALTRRVLTVMLAEEY
jgi:hypothetical protein